ncbi:MAG: SDR family oxidoreductase [Anaerolineae bacterium]|nr:SDR family oxidoreductase [Anaerolineae bacterium]
MERILITGTNRGIGLELTRQYSQRPDTYIFATARDPKNADELQAIAGENERVTVIQLSVTDQSQIEAAVKTVQEKVDALDVLINNAAINPLEATTDLNKLDPDVITHVLRVNVVAPIMIASAFASMLKAGENPRLVNLSSGAGSLTYRTNGGSYAYSTSKAAINMVTRNLAVDLKPVTCIALDPGWVKTDMGGPNAKIEPEEAIAGIIELIDGLGPEDNGGYRDYKGDTLPW